jgi:hypothetical protein
MFALVRPCYARVRCVARTSVEEDPRGMNLNHNHTLKSFFKFFFKGALATMITQLEAEPLYQDDQRLSAAGTKPNPGEADAPRSQG